MEFGTKLVLKKEWVYGCLTFEKGEILQVALYEHKYGLKLHHPRVGEIIDFVFGWNDRDERINEYFEILEDKKLSDTDIDFIKTLSNEMNTQDTRATAQPYALVVREEVTRLVPEGYSDILSCYWNDEEYYEWDDFITDLKEYYEYGTEAFNDYTIKDELNEIFEMNSFYDLNNTYPADKIEANIQHIVREQEIKEHGVNFFLTEKAYHQHIKVNGHNLNKPDSYGIHLYRNNEMQQLISVVHKLAKVL